MYSTRRQMVTHERLIWLLEDPLPETAQVTSCLQAVQPMVAACRQGLCHDKGKALEAMAQLLLYYRHVGRFHVCHKQAHIAAGNP